MGLEERFVTRTSNGRGCEFVDWGSALSGHASRRSRQSVGKCTQQVSLELGKPSWRKVHSHRTGGEYSIVKPSPC